jgi:hypothetical protein
MTARLASLTLFVAACATSTEVTPVVVDAARRAMSCEPIEVTALRTMKYEIRGCGQTTYWVCGQERFNTCCTPVESKQKLLKPIVLTPTDRQVCEPVAADVPFLSQ